MNSTAAPIRQPLIEMRKVVKTFRNAAGEFTVLKGIDTSFYEGEFVAVTGKSGSGKSTLVNMITGIDRPTSGEVLVSGIPIHHMNESQRAMWRGRNMGIVFQFFQLLPMLSLLENTMLPMDFCGMYPPAEREKRAMDLLRLVGLEEQAHKLPASVSGGQQQSAAIARALANDPPIIIADEPTGNLDTRTAEAIFELFLELTARRGKTIVMITHDENMARRMTRRVIISDGELVHPAVAAALPTLPHPLMLEATKKIRFATYQPGAIIIRQGEVNPYFYIIVSGKVEIVLKQPLRRDVTVAALGAGEFFGEIELVRGGKSIASVRASLDGPVELAVLDRETFSSLLGRSNLTQDAVAQTVQERLEQNKAGGRTTRRRTDR